MTACACLRSISKVSFYNASEYDEAGSLATVRRALELGITMLDTAEVYGGEEHENETWIGARDFASASLQAQTRHLRCRAGPHDTGWIWSIDELMPQDQPVCVHERHTVRCKG